MRGMFGEGKQNIIFQNFFHKCKLWIVWNWFIAKVILISQKYVFCCYSKWLQIKQCSKLEQKFVINFLIANCEIYRRMCNTVASKIKGQNFKT